MRARDLIKGSIAYHDTLNQDVWKGRELRVDVRYKLLEIAKRFIEYLEVPNFKLEDVILRGSLVNYNYTQYSDFDLHIVTDFSTLDCDITEAFYLAKKKIWNDEHDITIKGHEVEIYVEDKAAKNVSEGTYSVLDGKWLRTPKFNPPTINDRAVSAKARDLMTQINRAVKQGSIEDITRLQDKIRSMRQAGLDAGGEFSTENLAFKIIRNKKFLDKLYKTKNSKVDQELSLDEGVKQNAVMTALVAALSGSPAQANYCNPETTQSHPNQTQNAITIMRGITNVQNFERAGMHIEAVGEAAKLFKNIGKMPNKDCVAPIVKDQLPPMDSVNERKKAKKKKHKAKARRYGYPGMGYYGYYYGGNQDQSDSGGDAGGDAGGGGGESMYETETDWSQQVVMPWMKFMKMLAPQLTALGFHPYRQTDGGYEFHKRPNATTDISLSINEETATEFNWQCLVTVNNAIQPNANPHQGVLPMAAGSIAAVVESVKKMCGTNLQESEARLDPEVGEFLEGLTPDDVGVDEVGDYVVHYEGFTDQCQDSEEYQDDPEAVFNDVWGDFKRRMGDKDPINYGIVGDHDYPIVYSVFRK
jgi:hypothetical protein